MENSELNKTVSFSSKDSILSKVSDTLKGLVFPVSVAVCLGVGFIAGKMFDHYHQKINGKAYKQPINYKDVSIAINERNELMLVDRVSGEYVTYQDSVGRGIFEMYSKLIYLPNSEDKK